MIEPNGAGGMKIDIDQNSAYEETSVTIRCARLSREVTDLLALLRVYDEKLTGQRGGETHILNAADVLYADTADRRTFFYTAEGVYETELRLYELEQRLAGAGFLRAGKSLLLNFDHIRALRPDFGGRLLATLSNGEKAVISRQFVPAFRKKLGL